MAVQNSDITIDKDVDGCQNEEIVYTEENSMIPLSSSSFSCSQNEKDGCKLYPEDASNENNLPVQRHPQQVQGQSITVLTNKKQSKQSQTNLLVEVMSGPHEGATYLLKPRISRPCEIGRSKGKKFLSRGVSLHKDSEVSTCHGKFEFKAGKMYYTDTGSTNGTSYMGEAIQDNVPLEIENGMVLVFGMSELKFTLVEND